MIRNTVHAWGMPARALHWASAALVLTQFALGWLAVTWHLSPTKLELFTWHKSIGVLIFLLTGLRLAWRAGNPAPALPVMPHWQVTAARANHVLLYALLIAMPLTGWLINSAANIPFRIFWLVPLPDVTAPSKPLEELAKDIHFALFAVLVLALLVHVGAALHHHLVKRDDVLRRMVFSGRAQR